MRSFIGMSLLLAVAVSVVEGAQDGGKASSGPTIEPRSVQKLVADGKHNAFTTLVRWQDHYWLGFRKGSAHNSPDADVYLFRSSDGERWTEAMRLDILPDDRGGELVATPNRLFFYIRAMKGKSLSSYVLYTEDGKTWSKPEPIYQPQFIVWRPFLHQGRFYANAHKKLESGDAGKQRESQLITSTDGIHWEKISTVRAGNWESETTFWFGPQERLYAFIRTKYSTPGHIMESQPPYHEWTQRPAGVHFSGHSVYTFRGVTYLLSRTIGPNKKTGTMIYTFDGDRLTPYCALPSGGDCSYAEAVEVGDEMLVSYYSSHEGTTNIYTARVALKKS